GVVANGDDVLARLVPRGRRSAPRVPRRGARTNALELLWEPAGLPSFELPDELARLYPGTLGFPEEWLFANFVETIDGVVALPGVQASNRLIADASEADHFVMALLRACADVVLVGSATVRASPNAVWTAEAAYRDLAEPLRALRVHLDL